MKRTQPPRDKLLLEETYRKGAATVRADKLPTLYHLNPGFCVVSCEIQKAGAVERNGQRLEFQVLKVFLQERPASVATLRSIPPDDLDVGD